MNPNRRFLVLLALVSLASGLGAQNLIDQLYRAHRYELADAYWAAGQRFVDLGQAERGAEFKAAALRLFPGYVPGQTPAVSAQTAPQTAPPAAPKVPDVDQVREKNLQGEKVARLQFQKLLRGYLTANASTVASVLAPRLVVQGQAVEATVGSIAAFFEAHPVAVGGPDDLFVPGSIETTSGPGTTILVTTRAQADLSDQLAFWKPNQVYTFERVGETWKLASIEGL